MAIISVGNATSEIPDSHIYAFLQFINPTDQKLEDMIKGVLMRAPYGSRALETAQLFQRFLEDSKSRNESVLVNGTPIEQYLLERKKK